jgi:FkbM family methyltransferase
LPRRLLRPLARLAKPLVLPILNRLQLRMRSAIDTSEVPAALARVERLAEHISARTEAVSARVEAVLADAQRLERLGDIELRVEVLQQRLENTHNRLVGRLEEMQRQLEETQRRLEGVLLSQSAEVGAIHQNLNLLLQRNLVPFDDAMAIRTDRGYLLAPPEDLGLTLALLETRGSLEPGTAAVLTALAPPGGTVIDVGANVGMLTLPAARQVGPTGRVLALEAAPRVADLLSRMVRMNGLGWVEVCPMAAGDEDGVLRFNLSAQTTHNSVLPLDDVTETIEIPSRRLDTLLAPGERVDLVKIDVEGAELQVWRGMQRVVGDNPDIALVLEFGPSHLRKSGQSVAGWFESLESTGLKAWEIDEASGAVRPVRDQGLADLDSVNILLLRGSPASRGLKM